MLTNPLSLDLQKHIWRTYFSNIVLKEYNELPEVDLLKLLEDIHEVTPEDWNHLDIKSLMRELVRPRNEILRKHEEEKRRKEIQADWDFFVSIYPQFPK
jgi:hypothetical protein